MAKTQVRLPRELSLATYIWYIWRLDRDYTERHTGRNGPPWTVDMPFTSILLCSASRHLGVRTLNVREHRSSQGSSALLNATIRVRPVS